MRKMRKSTITWEHCQTEILVKMLFLALSQSENTFPNQVCWTFQNSTAAISRLNDYARKVTGRLPRLSINNKSILPKSTSGVKVNRLRQAYSLYCGSIFDGKRIIECTHNVWLVLIAEAHD